MAHLYQPYNNQIKIDNVYLIYCTCTVDPVYNLDTLGIRIWHPDYRGVLISQVYFWYSYRMIWYLECPDCTGFRIFEFAVSLTNTYKKISFSEQMVK